MKTTLDNINIIAEELIPTPRQVREELPLTDESRQVVYETRRALEAIIDRTDPRIFVVVGPCSIHDVEAAKDYAKRLKALSEKVSGSMLLVMRVYFEKPRTSVGWKGLINDPNLDDSFKIAEGLRTARKLLIDLAHLGVGAATEALDPVTPQYLSDVVCWTAIGARTTESQTHRELASGLSTPVGFKNGTDGNVHVAINALRSSATGHRFLGVNLDGQCAVMRTHGNRYGHIVLRGGARPNYDSVSVAVCEKELAAAGLPVNIAIDCSHGNSLKDPKLQPLVLENCVHQIVEGNTSIVGLMLESHIGWGRQDIPQDLKLLRYGVSVTDECIDWETTEKILLQAHHRLMPALAKRVRS